VDGLPLGIELAAARLRMFSPGDLCKRLRDHFDVLGSGPRDLPARQQTLRGTIQWSYELLDGEERTLFELASLFFPARVETVEGVAARLESLEDVDIVAGLSSLVDKSLLRSLNGHCRRLEMFDTIREYAARQRERDADVGTRASKAHAEYFVDFAVRRRDRLTGSEREDALEDLSSELGNLLAAWRHLVAAGDLEQLGRLLDPLWTLLDARGRYHTAVELANDLLHVLATVPPTPDRTRDEIMLRTSLARGLMAIRGYTEEVEEAYRRALELSDAVGEVPKRFPVLRSLATFHLYRGEFDRAAAVGRELLHLAEQDGDLGLQAEGHVVLGSSVAFLGDVPNGVDRLDRAVALFDPKQQGASRLRLGTSPGVVAHTTSALLLWLQGYTVRAGARARSGIELANLLNHPFTLAYARFHVGLFDLWRRDFAHAYERSSGALDVAEEHDYETCKALALALQGAAMTGLGRSSEGLARTDQGIALYQGLDTPPVFWPILHSIRAGAAGRSERAAEGLEGIDHAIELSGEENILYPEFAVLRGDLLLALRKTDGAEHSFQGALATARGFGLRTPQLHAALRLSRMWRGSARQREGVDLLRTTYESFTEGFEPRDLEEARAVLEELGDRTA
jgi:predicted ATPase